MKSYPHVTTEPLVMQGQPCIAGTRITVSNLVHQVGANRMIEEICKDYEIITAEQVRDALHFAADVLEHEEYALAAS